LKIMKSKITLLFTMLLITTFSFGQIIKPEKHRKFEGIKAEMYATDTLRHHGLYMYEKVMQQNNLNRKSNMLNSVQATKQKLDSIISNNWDESTSQWVVDYKAEYTYDDNGNMTQFLDYYWDESTSQWVVDYKTEYTYNNTYSFSDLILPNSFSDIGLYFNHMMTSYFGYDWDETNSKWDESYSGIFYYSELNITNVKSIETEIAGVYPNPVSDEINFDITNSNNTVTFELFDIQGRKLISREVTNNEQLSLEGLTNGIYLYNFIIDGKVQSGKLIKE
ncbi:MAG: T9SS type A sorting domain-containing protein, partial [Saprospiraceae bacterium]